MQNGWPLKRGALLIGPETPPPKDEDNTSVALMIGYYSEKPQLPLGPSKANLGPAKWLILLPNATMCVWDDLPPVNISFKTSYLNYNEEDLTLYACKTKAGTASYSGH